MDDVQCASAKEKKHKSKKDKRRGKETRTPSRPSLTEVALALRQMISFVRATIHATSVGMNTDATDIVRLAMSAKINIAYWEELTKKRK